MCTLKWQRVWKFRHLVSSSQSCGFKSGVHMQAQWVAVSRKCSSTGGLVEVKMGMGCRSCSWSSLSVCMLYGKSMLAHDGVAEGSLSPAEFPVPAGGSCWCCRAPPASRRHSPRGEQPLVLLAGWVESVDVPSASDRDAVSRTVHSEVRNWRAESERSPSCTHEVHFLQNAHVQSKKFPCLIFLLGRLHVLLCDRGWQTSVVIFLWICTCSATGCVSA